MIRTLLALTLLALAGCAARPEGGPDNTNWGALATGYQKARTP